ncbi:MAG: hypothetical protein E7420_06005 [Ruminococcaceae bacterium]|nr:hypothetical protein [Oscillospiraceae bacterium]
MDKRKNLRLREYSESGAYFVTVCSKDKQYIFGNIVGAGHPAGPHTELSNIGEIIEKHIKNIPNVYSDVFIDAYVVMPNHIHMLIKIDKPCLRDGQCPSPTEKMATLTKKISAVNISTLSPSAGRRTNITNSHKKEAMINGT